MVEPYCNECTLNKRGEDGGLYQDVRGKGRADGLGRLQVAGYL